MDPIFRDITEELNPLPIQATDGTLTFVKANEIFRGGMYFYNGFNPNLPGEPTAGILPKIIKETTGCDDFKKIFKSLKKPQILTPHQVINYCQNNYDCLRQITNGTFFLIIQKKKFLMMQKKRFSVARVLINSVGLLRVDVYKLKVVSVYDGRDRHHIVVPS